MAKKEIMLVCAAGMSTSLLVSKMEKAAEAQEVDAEIFATSANEADGHLEGEGVDVLMLGPQVKFMLSQFEQKVDGTGIPVEVIDMQDYGMVNGEKVLQRALELIEENN